MKTTYRVDGMTCGGCAASVTRAVEAISSAMKVEVDLKAKTITVAGDDEAETELIGRAVEEAGFDFGGRVSP